MDRVTVTRLRWRMRGAWMWPAFAVLTLLDAVLLHLRPIAGDATDPLGALILAAFFNILVVAVAAPFAGMLLRRRRRDLPRVVAHDYAGAALLPVVTLGLVVAGALHHSEIVAGQAAFQAQATAVRQYVGHNAPPAYRGNLDRADTRRVDSELFRTCVPGPDPDRALCVFVDTAQSPPGIRLDPNRETNESFGGRRDGPGP